MKKRWGYFFPLSLLICNSLNDFSGQSLLWLFYSAYCFISSLKGHCHFSVLALAPVSLEYAPESLITWRGLSFISLCAGIYHPDSLEILPGA